MRRRQILGLLSGAALASARTFMPANAQARAEVGWLAYGEGVHDENFSAFVFGLRQLGWREEANLMVTARFTQNIADLAANAYELLSRDLKVVVTVGVAATRIAKEATDRIPIIFGSVVDVVGNGIVADPNRPEGNLTGVVYLDETIPKLIELARELRPQTKGIAHVFEPVARGGSIPRELTQAYSDAARRLGVSYRDFPMTSVQDLPTTLDAAVAEGFDTLVVDNLGSLQFHRFPIVRHALARRLTPIGRERSFATAGGLASFGEEGLALYRRVAAHVDKVLRGAPVNEIPVEQADKFELVLNQRTAKALDLEFPLPLLARADEVIE